MEPRNGSTARQILAAALRRFADCGYAGTSVQDIVSAARVTKPTLYYYFGNKAELYQALVDSAYDERYRLMQEAVKRGGTLAEQLAEILAALFEYTQGHRELMRLAFATAFAAPDELPREINYLARRQRNFEFIHRLVNKGLAAGALDRRFDGQELAFGIYGLMNIYLMAHLVLPDCRLNRQTATRVVQLFLAGAGVKHRDGARPTRSRSRDARPA